MHIPHLEAQLHYTSAGGIATQLRDKSMLYVRHYNPLLIWNSSWILTILKAKGHSTKMNFKKWVKSIQTAHYNGVRTVLGLEKSEVEMFYILELLS